MRARRLAHCRGCQKDTAQTFIGIERGEKNTEFWRCVDCDLTLITYADVNDAEGLAIHLSETFLAATSPVNYDDVRSLEREDVLAQARAEMWAAYLAWDPGRAVRFRAFAVFRVNARLISWVRHERGFRRDGAAANGRPGPGKLHATAVSLDAPLLEADDGGDDLRVSGLEAVVGSGYGDLAEDRNPDLGRALVRRDRDVVREEQSMGLGPPSRAAG